MATTTKTTKTTTASTTKSATTQTMSWNEWGVELLWDGAGLVIITVVASISEEWAHAMLGLAVIILLLAIFNSPILNPKTAIHI